MRCFVAQSRQCNLLAVPHEAGHGLRSRDSRFADLRSSPKRACREWLLHGPLTPAKYVAGLHFSRRLLATAVDNATPVCST